jgi:hypothetical protein
MSDLLDPSNLEALRVLDETGRYVEVTNPVHRLLLLINEIRQGVSQLA